MYGVGIYDCDVIYLGIKILWDFVVGFLFNGIVVLCYEKCILEYVLKMSVEFVMLDCDIIDDVIYVVKFVV